MAGNFAWGDKAKRWWVMSTTICFQKLDDNVQQGFTFKPQTNFPAHPGYLLIKFLLQSINYRSWTPKQVGETLKTMQTDFDTQIPYLQDFNFLSQYRMEWLICHQYVLFIFIFLLQWYFFNLALWNKPKILLATQVSFIN